MRRFADGTAFSAAGDIWSSREADRLESRPVPGVTSDNRSPRAEKIVRGTDYEFPPEWESFTDEEKSDWFTQERCRRQAMRQETPFRKHVEMESERLRLRDRFRKFVRLGK